MDAPPDPPAPLPPLEELDFHLPPPKNKPRHIWTWDQISRRTSPKYIEELRAILIVDGNFTKFKRRLDELVASTDHEDFDIQNLGGSGFMWEAIKLDAAPFIEELLDRGVSLD